MKTKVRQAIYPLAILTGIAVMFALTLPRPGAAQQDQKNQPSQQDQQKQDQTQTEQQPKKKKGGLLGGIKSMTGSSSEQTKETASAGTKGALDGKQIANVTPTPADKQEVTDMKKYSVPPDELKKFQDDGKLQPKQ